ncbi:MAG: FaeA/PapI family transcriptional regulator [Chloroflexota bacterium]
MGLFSRQDEVTTSEIARALALSDRQARDLIAQWLAQGWLEMSVASRKGRRYRLSAVYRRSGAIEAGRPFLNIAPGLQVNK